MSAVATAIVGGAVVGGYMSSQASKSAAKTAANAQTNASNASIALQQQQFGELKSLLSPYVQAGTGSSGNAQVVNQLFNQYLGRNADPSALDFYSKRINDAGLDQVVSEISSSPEAQNAVLSGLVQPKKGSLEAQQDILGLNGNGAQQQAIQGIQSSPYYSAMVRQGEDAILQNASATGGLRGGNTQAALAQFRPALLNQLIQQQYTNLAGLTSLGQNSAAMTGNAGMQTGQNVSNQLNQIGAAQAGQALAAGKADAQMWAGIGNSVGTLGGMYATGAWKGF